MADQFSNMEDTIDSRDIVERVNEMFNEASARFDDAHPEGVSYEEIATLNVGDWLTEEDTEEYNVLVALVQDLRNAGEDTPEAGITMVRESYFDGEYAEQVAKDVGAIPAGVNTDEWPFSAIDWDAAADSLKDDHSEVDFDGVTYYCR